MTAHQAGILRHLDSTDPVMVTELADHVGVTPSTMSITLKRLERDGFVQRERDPHDRRVTNVILTEAGVKIREASEELDATLISDLLGLLTPDRRTQALRALATLADAADLLLRKASRSRDPRTLRRGSRADVELGVADADRHR